MITDKARDEYRRYFGPKILIAELTIKRTPTRKTASKYVGLENMLGNPVRRAGHIA